MKVHKIKRSDLQEIYSKVCSKWQGKIDEYLKVQKFNTDIEVENSLLLEAYKEGNSTHKKLIDSIVNLEHPKSLFYVKDYSTVCKELREDEITENDFKFLPKERRKKACAQAKIQQLEVFYNGDWIKDWKNKNQYKHYPYFDVNGPGGLVFTCVLSHYSSFVGITGYFKDSETAEFIGRNYKDIYEDLM